MNPLTRLFALCALALCCLGCAPDQNSLDSSGQRTRAPPEPADARLASLYKQSCRVCHGVPNTGAPLAGDRAAWDARWEKGMPTLVQNTIKGFNGMPPGGQCFACSAQDHEALIEFLAGRP